MEQRALPKATRVRSFCNHTTLLALTCVLLTSPLASASKLVPADHALFGVVLTPAQLVGFSLAGDAQANNFAPSVYNMYIDLPFHDDSYQNDTANMEWFLPQILAQGAIAMITVEPKQGLENVTESAVRDLAAILQPLEEQGLKSVIRFAHEPNGYWYPWGQNPILYNETFRFFVQTLRDCSGGQPCSKAEIMWAVAESGLHATEPTCNAPSECWEATFRFGPNSTVFKLLDTNRDGILNDTDDKYRPYYPGDDVVDWVGMSVYNWLQPPSENYKPPPFEVASTIDEFYSLFCNDTVHNKPLGLPETGAAYDFNHVTNLTELQVKEPFLRQMLNVNGDYEEGLDMAKHYPMLKMIAWMDTDWTQLWKNGTWNTESGFWGRDPAVLQSIKYYTSQIASTQIASLPNTGGVTTFSASSNNNTKPYWMQAPDLVAYEAALSAGTADKAASEPRIVVLDAAKCSSTGGVWWHGPMKEYDYLNAQDGGNLPVNYTCADPKYITCDSFIPGIPKLQGATYQSCTWCPSQVYPQCPSQAANKENADMRILPCYGGPQEVNNPYDPKDTDASQCKVLGFFDSGNWVYFGSQNLQGMKTMCVRAASPFAWGQHPIYVDLMLDTPNTGEKLGTVVITGTHDPKWQPCNPSYLDSPECKSWYTCYRTFCATLNEDAIANITWPRSVYFQLNETLPHVLNLPHINHFVLSDTSNATELLQPIRGYPNNLCSSLYNITGYQCSCPADKIGKY